MASYHNVRDNRGKFTKKPVAQSVNPAPALPSPAPSLPGVKPINAIALVLDQSPSMDTHLGDGTMQRVWEEQISRIKRDAFENRDNQRVVVWVTVFSTTVETQFYYHPESLPFVFPRGGDRNGTALLRAVINTQDVMRQWLDSETSRTGAEASSLIVTLTDGQENSSAANWHDKEEWRNRFKTLITGTSRYNFSYAFVGPRGCTSQLTSYGVPIGNVRVWDGSREELIETSRDMAVSYAVRSAAVASGNLLSTPTYFVDPGAHTKDFASLPDARAAFKRWSVEKQVEIMPFVESHKGVTYEPGRAYYQLTKPERVQAHKDIVVRDKASGKIVEKDVKQILGIQPNARVKPGNLGNFEVFVRSTSVNRKLVPGTYLLWRQK